MDTDSKLKTATISEPFWCWQCPFYSAKMYCNITGKVLGGVKGRDPVLPPENCFITNTDVIYIRHNSVEFPVTDGSDWEEVLRLEMRN